MSWREDLRPASFRGVLFDVEGDSGSFGRRVQVHEYPQRDKPWAEDLGRATRTFEITAFVVGDDYLARRDALLAALETEGPGTLVHPWYGELTVNVKELARIGHSHRHGGMCEISLSFVEAGELTFPKAQDSLGAQSLIAADAVDVATADDFAGVFVTDGQPSFVLDSVVGDLKAYIAIGHSYLDTVEHVLANPLESLLELAGLPTNPIGSIEDYLGLPDGISRAVRGLFDRAEGIFQTVRGRFGRDSANARNRNTVIALTQLSRAFGAQAVLPGTVAAELKAAPAAPDVLRQASVQVQINRAALATLLQRATLVQAAGMSAVIVLPVYDDAVLVRDAVVAAIEEASFDAGDEIYVTLQVLRARVYADITARLSQAARLLDYTPRQVMPALVLAYDLYEDVDREAELVERNNIRHPGFLPVRPLKVLSA